MARDSSSENVGAKASGGPGFFILLPAVTVSLHGSSSDAAVAAVAAAAAASLPTRPDEGENDFADSSARFSYSWYNNDDNDNNNGNDYVSETTGSLTNGLCVGTGSLAYRPD